MRRLMIAGNWKMNASTAATSEWLEQLSGTAVAGRDVLVCPPFPYLSQFREAIADSQLMLGAQNCSTEDSGAFTGEVSASMLRDLACEYVILGHSERRALFGETDEIILAKTRRALSCGLKVILCVGETLEDRQAGNEENIVRQQLSLALSELSEDDWRSVVIAYEPVWAIGTGETATPAQAQAIHAFIRSLLTERAAELGEKTRILYGGSVNSTTAEELFAQADIDGGLVGGASLDAEHFLKICTA